MLVSRTETGPGYCADLAAGKRQFKYIFTLKTKNHDKTVNRNKKKSKQKI